METAPPRFAVDKMLGRLAAWLRLTGYDATYGPHLSGRALLRHARNEERIILTRDRRVLRERPPRVLLVESDHYREQLRQVVRVYGLDPFAQLFTRCRWCNVAVVAVPKAAVVADVPPYVAQTQDHFVRCPRCRRIYWPATHADHVRHELQQMGLPPQTSSSQA